LDDYDNDEHSEPVSLKNLERAMSCGLQSKMSSGEPGITKPLADETPTFASYKPSADKSGKLLVLNNRYIILTKIIARNKIIQMKMARE
jgi:hypothetical protein